MNHTSRSVVTATRKRKDRGEIENSSFYKGSFGNSHHKPLSSAGNNNIMNNNNNIINNNNHNSISTTSSTPTTPSTSARTIDSGSGLGFNSSTTNPVSSNRLLAGYMAHEFLTKGTLFGQKFDPARAEAVPVSAAEPKRKSGQTGFEPGMKPNRSYADVAQLLKADGAHIPGIVNPTQLARWIQM